MSASPACHHSGGANETQDAGSADSKAVGVADCDTYLAKYAQCIERAPADRRKALHEDLERTQAAWKSLAKNPGARPSLGQSCRLALDTARANMTQYGCTW